MRDYLERNYGWFLDPARNVLKHFPPQQAFTFSIILAGLWSLAFCLYIGELMMIAPWMLGHFSIILCIFTTWVMFKDAEDHGDIAPKKGIQQDSSRPYKETS